MKPPQRSLLFLVFYVLFKLKRIKCFVFPRNRIVKNSNDLKKHPTICQFSEFSITDKSYDHLLLDTDERRVKSLNRLRRQNQGSIHNPSVTKINNECCVQPTEFPYLTKSKNEYSEKKLLNEDASFYRNLLGEDYMFDKEQVQSIKCNAPAILLESGPGTGKSSALTARIAHLIRSKQCDPDKLIVLSFTNKDAYLLKQRGLQKVYPEESKESNRKRDLLGRKIWSGTIHSFAKAVLKKYGRDFYPSGYISTAASLRVISSKEMKDRVRNCIFSMTKIPSNTEVTSSEISSIDNKEISAIRILCKNALKDVKQNMHLLLTHIVRSIELWKEATILQSTSATNLFSNDRDKFINRNYQIFAKDCIELAMRLGIPFNVAKLALYVYPEYQSLHFSSATTDPCDMSSVAYELLLSDPAALNAIRTKLQHVILDEYQDLSVSQHALLRLIITGNGEEESDSTNEFQKLSLRREKSIKNLILTTDTSFSQKPKIMKTKPICYEVPKLFCAGDMKQSIYGWRGAAPSLTVDGFCNDFPQGITVPLGTCYRIPRYILNAANVLLGAKEEATDGVESFIVSPSCKKSVSNLLSSQQTIKSSKINSDFLEEYTKLCVQEGIMSESSSSVYIRGLWDAREEAKYIASTIRKRAKQRLQRCQNALKDFNARQNDGDCNENVLGLYDPSDIAIMVRSSTQLQMIEEALKAKNIPYDTSLTTFGSTYGPNQYNKNFQGKLNDKKTKALPLKPVKLITMHGSKGEEFDEIYLAGWTEGVFPHPSSLSSNRLNEERRLAYVALTRARQRVFITYSFVARVPYYNNNNVNIKKYVTEQVRPSRFLFDLVYNTQSHYNHDSDSNQDCKYDQDTQKFENTSTGIYWDKRSGIKDFVAGQNLPQHFSKSYHTPTGYSKKLMVDSSDQDIKDGKYEVELNLSTTHQSDINIMEESNPASRKDQSGKGSVIKYNDLHSENLEFVTRALKEITVEKRRGSCKKYRQQFLTILKESFEIKRGSAPVVTKSCKSNEGYHPDFSHILLNESRQNFEMRPLSKCTATQLGQYLVYLIAKEQSNRSL